MTPNVPAVKITVKRNVFDLAKFDRATVEKEIEFSAPKTMDEALAALNNDADALLKVVVIGLRKQAINDAKASMGDENFVSPKVISGFVNQFKPLYPAKSDSKADKADQRKAIYGFIKGNEGLLAIIKQLAAATAPDDDEDEVPDAEDGE